MNELEQLQSEGREKNIKTLQLKMLYKRSKILRLSIISISFSIVCSSFIIPVLLVMYLFDTNLKMLGVVLFLFSILGIIISAFFSLLMSV